MRSTRATICRRTSPSYHASPYPTISAPRSSAPRLVLLRVLFVKSRLPAAG